MYQPWVYIRNRHTPFFFLLVRQTENNVFWPTRQVGKAAKILHFFRPSEFWPVKGSLACRDGLCLGFCCRLRTRGALFWLAGIFETRSLPRKIISGSRKLVSAIFVFFSTTFPLLKNKIYRDFVASPLCQSFHIGHLLLLLLLSVDIKKLSDWKIHKQNI